MKTITEPLTVFKLKRIKVNKNQSTLYISSIFIHLLHATTWSALPVHGLSPEKGNSTTYCTQNTATRRLQRKIFKSTLHQYDKQDKTLMSCVQSYNITSLKQQLEPFFLFQNTCSDTELEVQCWKNIISIFPTIQTLKSTLSSNKLIVYHIKNISSFKVVRGYMVCTI